MLSAKVFIGVLHEKGLGSLYVFRTAFAVRVSGFQPRYAADTKKHRIVYDRQLQQRR